MSIEDRVPMTIPEKDTDSETEYHEIDITSSNDSNDSNDSDLSDAEQDNDNDLDIEESSEIEESIYYDSFEQITRVTSQPKSQRDQICFIQIKMIIT